MQRKRKIEKIIDIALTEELENYEYIIKMMRKKLPLFNGSKRLAAAILKDYLGDITDLDMPELGIDKDKFTKRVNSFSSSSKSSSPAPKSSPVSKNGEDVVFEDIKDGRARLFINIGKNHRMSTGNLIREIVNKSGIDGKQIGKIDIHGTYSFFEVPEESAMLVYKSFNGTLIKNIPVVVEPAKRRKKEN